MPKETVLSGIRATGRLHFGNFMGAVTHFVNYQKPENRCMYFIADLHTLTTLKNPEELRGNVLEITKDYLAAGLDPNESVIYAQSSVPEIAELSLLLSMYQPLGDLQRIPTFKDLLRKNPDNVSLGLITYPVLMAADILGPQASIVPVGSDQVPNVELAQHLAKRFNERFGQTFIVPKTMEEMIKVPGLDGDKMGKSDANNAIDINAPISVIRELYRKRGITDPGRMRRSDPGNPDDCRSVYPLHQIITRDEVEGGEIRRLCSSAGIGCVECKDRLVDSISSVLVPFQERRLELAERDDYAREVLHEGGKRARELIKGTLEAVRDKVGVVVY